MVSARALTPFLLLVLVAPDAVATTPSASPLDVPWADVSARELELSRTGFPVPTPAAPVGTPDDARWSPGFHAPGFNGPIISAIEFDGDLLVGGHFSTVGGALIRGLARWDGTAWTDAWGWDATGIVPAAYALLEHEGRLWIGGGWGGGNVGTWVARYDGAAWERMGSYLPGGYINLVTDIVIHDGAPVICGTFRLVGNEWTGSVVRWNGEDWEALVDPDLEDAPFADGSVTDLLVVDGDLYALGGEFPVGEEGHYGVARWDGKAWQAVGPDPGFQAAAMVFHEGLLYVGGADNVARPDTSPARLVRLVEGAWEDVDLGWNGKVSELAVRDGALLAGGSFLREDGTRVFLAEIGEQPQPWDGGPQGAVYVIGDHAGDLLVGGEFYRVDGDPAVSLACFDGSRWRGLGDQSGLGTSFRVESMIHHDGELLVGGAFDHAGVDAISGVARWDGQGWAPMGEGPRGVTDLLVFRGDPVAAGGFRDAGPDAATGLARWDGAAWRALGEEPGWTLGHGEIAVFRDRLYAIFGEVGHVGIRAWDGEAWSEIDMEAPIRPLCIQNLGEDYLLVAGRQEDFYADDQTLVYSWDGSTWTDLEFPGPYFELHDIINLGDRVALATDSYRYSTRGIYVWSPDGWSQLPPNDYLDDVYDIVEFEDQLVAGGAVRSTRWSYSTVYGLARLDGDTWKPLGSGLPKFSPVLTLAVFQGDLYVGGQFGVAGDKVSSHFARFEGSTTPVRLLTLRAEREPDGPVAIAWEIAAEPADLGGFHVHRDTGRRVRLTEKLLLGGVSYRFVDATAPAGPVRYWLEERARSGESLWHGPVEVATNPSSRLGLAQNLPNPFSDRTRMAFSLPAAGPVRLVVLDAAGREVRTLAAGLHLAGDHALFWDGRDARGREVPAGVYFYRLETRDGTRARRLVRTP